MDIKNGRFYLGDCLEVMKEIPDGVIDLTVTSPPYDDLRNYNGYSFDFENTAKELYRITKEGGVVVWNVNDAKIDGSETGTSFRQALFFMECGFKLNDTMIWLKPTFSAVGALKTQYAPVFEYMFVFTKGKGKTFNPLKDRICKTKAGIKRKPTMRGKDGKIIQNVETLSKEFGQRFNVWIMNTVKQKGENVHPAPFPLELARDHILSWSNEGDLVFDPFGGSGTTACAAIDTNRKWVTCEISEEYATKAVERIWNHEATLQEKPEGEVKIDSNIPVPEGEENGN